MQRVEIEAPEDKPSLFALLVLHHQRRDDLYDVLGSGAAVSPSASPTPLSGGTVQPSSPPGGWYTTTTLTIGQSYDGDGGSTKRVETKTQSTPFYVPVTTVRVDYYLRSSVLGGQVITELSSTGQKTKTKVFAGGAVVAEQQLYNGGQQSIVWKHVNPVTVPFLNWLTRKRGVRLGASFCYVNIQLLQRSRTVV